MVSTQFLFALTTHFVYSVVLKHIKKKGIFFSFLMVEIAFTQAKLYRATDLENMIYKV